MYGSCHIRSVLIGIEYRNRRQNLDAFCYSTGANLLKTKLQTGQSISYEYVYQF